MIQFLPTILGATLLVASSYTQEPPAGQRPQPGTQQPQDRTQQQTPGRVAGAENADAILVTTLLVANENEIALARLAQQRATSPDVKQFAQKMIDDHGKAVQKLQQAGGDAARTGQQGQRDPARDPSRSQEATTRPSSTQPADASGVRVGAAGGGIDHERLMRDLGKKCLESATAMLNEKQGAEFDRCYMGMQLGAHMKAVDTIEVFRNYASPALRPTLDEELKVVQAHLQHAKELAKRTDEVASAGAPGRK